MGKKDKKVERFEGIFKALLDLPEIKVNQRDKQENSILHLSQEARSGLFCY